MRFFEAAHRAIGTMRLCAAELSAAARQVAFPVAGTIGSPAAIDAARLESRVMLSATPFAMEALMLPDAIDSTFPALDFDGDLADFGELNDSHFDFFSGATEDVPLPIDLLSAEIESAESAEMQELVFIDSTVEQSDQLVEGLLEQKNDGRSLEIYFLESDRDGIEQIGEILTGRSGVDAVHLVSHGTDGRVNLGNTWLSNDNLDSYAQNLASWSNALRDGADLLIYGCDLASNDDGQALRRSDRRTL